MNQFLKDTQKKIENIFRNDLRYSDAEVLISTDKFWPRSYSFDVYISGTKYGCQYSFCTNMGDMQIMDKETILYKEDLFKMYEISDYIFNRCPSSVHHLNMELSKQQEAEEDERKLNR